MEPPMKDYEKNHISLLKQNTSECTLFLKRDENSFPLSSPCKLILIGSGARETLKGGTGSGDVESRFFTTCEEGLENSGFEVLTKDWLTKYSTIKQRHHSEFVENVKQRAEKNNCPAWNFSMGCIQPEPEYKEELDLEKDKDFLKYKEEAECAIYVLSRNSGENSDRQKIKGDIFLTDTEINDILFLNEKFSYNKNKNKKFLLVLNVCGVVDISPVVEKVDNILYLSMLGVVTGDILSQIVLGKSYPSGKLSTSWAKFDNYKFMEDFGDYNDTRYKEGVYVGYRYFDSQKMVKPLFPFGFGLSYTKFLIEKEKIDKVSKDNFKVFVKVKNIGKFIGKEVIQIYISPSQNNKDKPYQSLINFKKTKELKPNEEEIVEIDFNIRDISRFDEDKAQYILDNGNYFIRVGNSSIDTKIFGYINLNEDIVVKQLQNKCGKPDFDDYKPEKIKENEEDLTKLEKFELFKNDFEIETIIYNNEEIDNPKIDPLLQSLSDEDLVNLCIGHYVKDSDPNPTLNSLKFPHIMGEAGETSLHIKQIDKYIIMVDGPAGIRISKKYGEDEKGKFRLFHDPIRERIRYYVTPEVWAKEDHPDNNKNRISVEEDKYQFTTALPIATAIAQSFNEDFAEICGDIVGNEMEIFGIHLWLAPALNIHRNILCGRNFEYFSEDPVVSGKMTNGLTRGVQKHKNCGVTIKHFACNNQEFNRKNSNTIISERALREIYLKGFEIGVKNEKPVALMTSYNLINGIHASERKDLVVDILRKEWEFNGLIMSDWYRSFENMFADSKYPAQNTSLNILGGNNLQMGGRIINFNDLMDSVKNKKVSREDLLKNAQYVYNAIQLLNQ